MFKLLKKEKNNDIIPWIKVKVKLDIIMTDLKKSKGREAGEIPALSRNREKMFYF